jgi:Raf kinase inhibitor-like YbhB/YbcL family protein
MSSLTLTSPGFDDGERMPDHYAYTAENVNPPLSVAGVPAEARSLALIVDDPDAEAATGTVFDHWVVWNIAPDRTHIPEGWAAGDDGAVEGANGLGEPGFLGFNPPDREHVYKFRLYALEATLDLPAGASKADLRAAMADHVLAETLLEGRFAPEQVPDDVDVDVEH